MARLLVVHHTPSPGMGLLLDAALAGARDPSIEGVEVITRPALEAGVDDVLVADGFLLGTPANFGYMSGALKHFFDQIYEPCLGVTRGRPFGLYVHGNNDTSGARASVEKITTGLRWRLAARPVETVGDLGSADTEACAELGAALAASLVL